MLNKVVLIGRLGADPEVKQLSNGTIAANFSMATNAVYTDRNTNERVENTTWHNLEAYGAVAENIGEYLSKGKLAYIEGTLLYDKYQKEGEETARVAPKIKVSTVRFLSSNSDQAE